MEPCYDLKTILKLKSIQCIDYIVIQKLEKAGVKSVSRISENKDCKARKVLRNGVKSIFGVSLESEAQSTQTIVIQDHTVYLPKFFVMAITFLNNHTTCEGIFRKAGSISRQKTLRATVIAGHTLSDSTSPHDVAALLKQYLRELPDPLLTNRLYPVFIEIIRSNRITRTDKEDLILLTCLLLPDKHLLCLKVLMLLLHKITKYSQSHSLMDSDNLALVLSPNILSCLNGLGSSKQESVCFDLKSTTDATKVLIDRADSICIVSVDMFNTEDASDKIRLEHQTPWKGYVTDKIRGTWSRIRGKGHLKSDDEMSMSKRPALDDSDDGLLNTPSVYGTGRRQRKIKPRRSILVRKKKRQCNFTTLFTTPPAKSENSNNVITTNLLTDNTRTTNCTKNVSSSGVTSKPVTAPGLVEGMSIGQRVHKRKQFDRELTESCSNDCIKASHVNHILPVSQSDSYLFHSLVTPVSTTSSRPKLRAIFSHKTTKDKRKGFVHEPGLDNLCYTVPKKQRKSKSVNHYENICLVSASDDEISVNSISLKEHSIPNGDRISPIDESDSWSKTPPAFTSPGLLRKVTSEITEMFELTPKQLAPMTNNDSYLFAVEDTNDNRWIHSSLKRGPLEIDNVNITPLTTNTRPPLSNISKKAHNMRQSHTTNQTSHYLPTSTTIVTSTTPAVKCINKPSKRSSAWSDKLNRRAKQYVVVPENSTNNYSLRKKPHSTNKQHGIQVSHWIV